MSHAGKIVFMVPAGKQVHQFQSTTVLQFLPLFFVSWSSIVRTSCPCWVEPGFLLSLKYKAHALQSLFQCCPHNNHWVLAEHNNSYYVPQIFGFGCAVALHLEKVSSVLLLIEFQSQYSAAEGIGGVTEGRIRLASADV